MIKKFDLHPLLIASIPVLFIGARNLNELMFIDLFVPLLLSLGSATILTAVCFLFTKKVQSAILLSSAIFAFSFLYGHYIDYLTIRHHVQSSLQLNLSYALIGVILLVLVLVISCYKNALKTINSFITITSSVFLALIFFNGSMSYISQNKNTPSASSNDYPKVNYELSYHQDTESDVQEKPDIYYIILDGYARHDSLKNVHGYDNQPFLEDLKSQGFYIPTKSTSNYTMTHLSLPSSLNMNYINREVEINGNQNYQPYFQLIQNSQLVKCLKSFGYKIITFSSGWGPTNNKWSTSDFHFGQRISLSDYQKAILRMTAFRNIIDSDEISLRLNALNQIKSIPKLSKTPKFTFVHLVMPHPPYLFDKDGNTVALQQTTKTEKELYVEQIQFLNTKISGIVQSIIAQSESIPIIILQADHGSEVYLESYKGGTPSIEQANERFSIFNAYYGPDELKEKLYPTITPVNSFRVVLNFLNMTSLPLLPDKNYFYWYYGDEKIQDLTAVVTQSPSVS
tara:strand:+ start:31657 stop:33189 length:1533 start_codon:yes stop_codon:yes gene_type:complete